MSQFCKCHDSWAVVTRAKLWHDGIIIFQLWSAWFFNSSESWVRETLDGTAPWCHRNAIAQQSVLPEIIFRKQFNEWHDQRTLIHNTSYIYRLTSRLLNPEYSRITWSIDWLSDDALNSCYRHVICSHLVFIVQDRWARISTQCHYSDVIMGAMASQITNLMIVYSTVYSGADQRKHQSSASLAIVRGIHRWPVNSPHTWPVRLKMFPFDDVIMPHRLCFMNPV